ncbi:G-D-S-L family lipolytic protein [Mucilaginibacter sp. RS28]|uniref:G-D-S-L family lipolytic protein n=1 Tax=Mucilaginibacter straminoryzae TaxID=2932774 RepID=A0A9X2BCK8_9SPHI|nr:SGNH/GDSL hydrolase family protein [Mucilaginibacter straminoryzae]MCJ8209418.1 G-D-S-L family lipolytic protein [Mucilaginibacter straminoryzae]
MNKIKNIFLAAAAVSAFAACKTEVKTTEPTHGSADFSRYVAVGNSLTAGYADGGLYLDGQQNSYPSIIAKQMQGAGGGTFTQPLFSADQANGSGYITLTGFDQNGSPVTAPVTSNLAIRGVVNIPSFGNVTTYTKYTGDINNYGVPGIKLLHITLNTYGNLNGYFERLLPGNAGTNTTSYLDFVTAKPFTFFTNWLGNNDALGYATSGGAGDVLTDKATFAQLYTLLLTRMTANGAKGVCATIPDVTSIPYFNTVTPALILANVQKANPAAQAIYINAKSNADPTGTAYAARPATANDLITLTFPTSKIGQPVASAGNLPYGLTPLTPIDNQYVLDANEVAIVKDYVTYYNNTIKSVAASKGIAVADMYTFFNDIAKNGLVVDGVNLNAKFISGGLFSLDGVHLTPRGYAIVANQFIKALNAQYNATVPLANVAQYRSVKFPN